MKRNLYQSLLKHLDKKEYTVIIGARQTGKSTLMRQLETHCKSEQIPFIFLNLENKNILYELDKSPLNILAYLPVVKNRVIVFIDEFQYLQDPSNFLKLIYDEYAEKIKIVATGSSAFYLDTTFKDSLSGRKKIFYLQTCGFDEYLQLRGLDDLYEELIRLQSNKEAKSVYIDVLHQEWRNYMLYGGYPAVITEPDNKEKIVRLAELRDAYVKRDILEAGVQNETAFYYLFRILAAQSGNLLNTNDLALSLRIKHETVTNYLAVLQKCFHIVLLKPFYRNLKKELVKMPKVFLTDTGMLNSLLNNFQPLALRSDKGMIWETLNYKLLSEKYGPDEILFWRTTDGNEVDFVLPYIESPFAVEVKFDKTSIRPNKYKKFTETYPDIPLSFRWLQPFEEKLLNELK
ncbi:MAG: ATP-binding protein [Candidatus Azobacteroides sp.]|nr:ATP-binding protein [Candidatus Azobacteroides sp.]